MKLEKETLKSYEGKVNKVTYWIYAILLKNILMIIINID
jgi:hypothetical protein